eukprot:gene27398-4695_t
MYKMYMRITRSSGRAWIFLLSTLVIYPAWCSADFLLVFSTPLLLLKQLGSSYFLLVFSTPLLLRNSTGAPVRLSHTVFQAGINSSFICKYASEDYPQVGLAYLDLPSSLQSNLSGTIPSGYNMDWSSLTDTIWILTLTHTSGIVLTQYCYDESSTLLRVVVPSRGSTNAVHFLQGTTSSWGAKAFCMLQYGGGLADVSTLETVLENPSYAKVVNVRSDSSFFTFSYSQQMGDVIDFEYRYMTEF